MPISISLTVDSGYLLVPVLHDLYDGFYVPVSWQRRQKTVLLSGFPPLVNAVLSNIKYLVDGSLKREDSLVINVARNNWIVANTTEVEIQLVSHINVFDTVLVTPSSQGVAIRTQEDCPWAFDNKLLRLNAYSHASYEVILTSEIGTLSRSLSASSPRYSIKSYGSFILLKADSADSVNLVLGCFTYYPPPDYYGSVKIDISVSTAVEKLLASSYSSSLSTMLRKKLFVHRRRI